MPVIFTKKLHQWIWHNQFVFLSHCILNSCVLLFTVPFLFFLILRNHLSCFQFRSAAQWCLTLCDSMDCSMLGFPVYQQLSQLAQTHVHSIGNVTQPSHLLSSPSSPAFNLSQSGSFLMSQLLAQGGKSIEASALASVLPKHIHGWFPLGLISFHLNGLSRVFSNTTVQKH